MRPTQTSLNVVARRLTTVRQEAGLSQRRLGIVAGMDETVASPRINQYEHGKHLLDIRILDRLGEVLNRPLVWFFCEDDDLAELILSYHQGTKTKKRTLLRTARQ